MNQDNPDFVSGLAPHDAPSMSRDERNGCAGMPVLKHVGICRHCGAEVRADDWFNNGNVCARCG